MSENNTALRDADADKKLVQLLVVADGQLDVTGDDASLFVVSRGIAGELKDLGSEVLEDGAQVDRGAGTDAGGVLALLQVAADTANRKLKTSLGRSASGLAGLSSSSLSSLSLSSGGSSWWHFKLKFVFE